MYTTSRIPPRTRTAPENQVVRLRRRALWGVPTLTAALLAAALARGMVSHWTAAGILLLGVLAFGAWLLVRWRARPVVKLAALVLVLAAIGGPLAARTYLRYSTAGVMRIPIQEFSNAEYPEDPAARGPRHGQYQGRELTLVQRDDRHFDFIFEPKHPHIARVVLRNVDVSLMTPSLPAWTKGDDGLRRIALTDRQWNRQQVRFDSGSVHIEVTGGDGFEKQNLYTVELAKNCLNAGLWELLLFTNESGTKELYYQGWFDFPLGHYKRLFEQNTGLAYRNHWYYLEHWFDPAGTRITMSKLRQILAERDAPTRFDPNEPLIAAGEQVRKRRTTVAPNVVAWKDVYEPGSVQFASFIPPGRYSVDHPWKNHYPKIDRFRKLIVRDIRSPGSSTPLQEIELVFGSSTQPGIHRLFVSGIDLASLPQLAVRDYSKGLYMPMGVGSPPFYQSYDELQRRPPHLSPYVSVLLDEQDRWVDHHSFAIDGVAMHRDETRPDLVHLYLLSYERHMLIGHFVISAPSQQPV